VRGGGLIARDVREQRRDHQAGDVQEYLNPDRSWTTAHARPRTGTRPSLGFSRARLGRLMTAAWGRCRRSHALVSELCQVVVWLVRRDRSQYHGQAWESGRAEVPGSCQVATGAKTVDG
jgi:hypothetical protein